MTVLGKRGGKPAVIPGFEGVSSWDELDRIRPQISTNSESPSPGKAEVKVSETAVQDSVSGMIDRLQEAEQKAKEAARTAKEQEKINKPNLRLTYQEALCVIQDTVVDMDSRIWVKPGMQFNNKGSGSFIPVSVGINEQTLASFKIAIEYGNFDSIAGVISVTKEGVRRSVIAGLNKLLNKLLT